MNEKAGQAPAFFRKKIQKILKKLLTNVSHSVII